MEWGLSDVFVTLCNICYLELELDYFEIALLYLASVYKQIDLSLFFIFDVEFYVG